MSEIQFQTGPNNFVFEVLKSTSNNIPDIDKNCVLMFDEVKIDNSFFYDIRHQQLFGFEDLGHLGRTSRRADSALVFMIRGIHQNYKQVVGYYFTSKFFTAQYLKLLIVEMISKLFSIGFNVRATVCDQAATNRSALSLLCFESKIPNSSDKFLVENHPIYVMFDVPHLLKSTRNALLTCKLEYKPNQFALFSHIQKQTILITKIPFLK